MHEFLIFLTYVAEGLAGAAVLLGFVLLVRSGPPSEEEATTYWVDDQLIGRREYEVLMRDRMAAARRRADPPA